ncbi:hypothetical protein IPM65_00270 [Candidatus Roizmanbacteria bacterium]|nr:MAG: hypothetical protein IPM65_00270 [Candidatus Roizmanbacteria bacterium]
MLAAEHISTLLQGPPYYIPGQPGLQGLNGFFLSCTRARADDPETYRQHIQKGYIDEYVRFEREHQPAEVQEALEEIQAIPDSRRRTEALLTLLQEVSAAYAYPTPQWVKESKPMYQIMVDRFCNPNLWSPDVEIREAATTHWHELQNRKDRDFFDNVNFAGGTLEGIIANIDYLKNIAGGLYLNPIFESDTVHGYNTADYTSVNHRFAGFSDAQYYGADERERAEMKMTGLQQFDALTDHIPVVLDIAVNHTGRAHTAFQDIEKNGIQSSYTDWYRGLQFDQEGKLTGWKGWWGHDTLPELDHHSAGVRDHFLGEGYAVGKPLDEQTEEWKTWVTRIQNAGTREAILEDPQMLEEAQKKLGVIGFWSAMMSGEKKDGTKKNGGWRLDVPNDINRPEFWNEFRTLVKTIDPELWIVGEIWDNENEAHWLNGDKFDGVMNYRFWQKTLDFLIGDTPTRRQHLSGDRAYPVNAYQFADYIKWFVSRHPKQVVETMMNNAGTHDVIRLNDLLGHPEAKWDKTAVGLTMIMTLPGSPCLWSGDELGMNNRNCPIVTDPMNRKPFEWDLTKDYPAAPKSELLGHVQRLSTLREQSHALQTANIRFINTGNPNVLAYVRESDPDDPDADEVLVIVNRSGNNEMVCYDAFAGMHSHISEYLSTKDGVSYDEYGIMVPENCSVVYTSS